jgi:hypothetical protein
MADLPITDEKNIVLHDDLGNKVSVVLGSLNKLAVDATISGDESPTKYQARFAFDEIGDVLNTATDVSLFLFTGVGILDFIGIGGSNSNFIVVIKIDGVERLRVSTAQLNAIGLVNTTTSPIWVETADKNFRYNPAEGAGFSVSFEVLARATVGTPTTTHFITYREKT